MAEDVVIFPHSEIAITAQDPRNTTALLQAVKERQLVVFIPRHNSKDVVGSIGTLALVRKAAVAEGGVSASVKGLWRVRVENVLEEMAYARVRFTKAAEIDDAPTGGSRVMEVVLGQIDEFVKLIPGIPAEITGALRTAETPGKLADLCAYSPGFSSEERLDLLRTLGAEERLEKVSKHFEMQLTALRELAKVEMIPECETCMELADRVFESNPNRRGEIASEFLNHVVQKHSGELLGLIAEKYGPVFMTRRALK
ncbi:MAG: LON peptidase substrate-binding domain-containing protein [Nitrososphaerales archaeon]